MFLYVVRCLLSRMSRCKYAFLFANILVFVCFALSSVNERSPVHSVSELQEMLNDEIQRSQMHATKVNQLIHQLMQKQLKAQQESAKRFSQLFQRIANMKQLADFSSASQHDASGPGDEPDSSGPGDEQVRHHYYNIIRVFIAVCMHHR